MEIKDVVLEIKEQLLNLGALIVVLAAWAALIFLALKGIADLIGGH